MCSGGTATPGSSDRRQLKELSALGGGGSFAGLAHLQKALKEQERFCRGLASHQLPPPLLDIPWLPSTDSGSSKKPRQQGGGGRLGGAASARQLAQAGQPAGEAADGGAAAGAAGGAAGLAAHNLAMAQHEQDVYQLISQVGPGQLGTQQQQQPQLVLAPAPFVAGSNAARLMLVPDIRSRLLPHPPFQMYVFADGDIVSGQIARDGSWEQHEAAQLVGKLGEVAQVRGAGAGEGCWHHVRGAGARLTWSIGGDLCIFCKGERKGAGLCMWAARGVEASMHVIWFDLVLGARSLGTRRVSRVGKVPSPTWPDSPRVPLCRRYQ